MLKKLTAISLPTLLIISTSIGLDFGPNLRRWSEKHAQSYCKRWIGSQTELEQLAQALFCAKKNYSFKELSFTHLFHRIGLMHLLVTSGAHIFFILQILKALPLKIYKYLAPLVLLVLLFCSGFAPPVLRSILQILLTPLSQKLSLGHSHFRRVSFANVTYLMLFPADLLSLSFQLSALASYTIALTARSTYWLNISVFLVLSPLLLQLQQQNLLFIYFNLLLAPFLGILIITLGILGLVSHTLGLFLNPFIVYAIQWAHKILPETPAAHSLMPYLYSPSKLNCLIYFLMVVSLCEIIHYFKSLYYQKSFFSHEDIEK